VLCEDHLVGLHGVADPQNPQFLYRTLTPVTLLSVNWPVATEAVLARVFPGVLTNHVQKMPFLSGLALCQNWHLQAILRFAELSSIESYKNGSVILEQGRFGEHFYIIFEGSALVSQDGRRLRTIRCGDFFGEIGLLQNSNVTATVSAGENARCLKIPRRDFLRFVAHNYSVALELERVSSQRLGHPIFPLTKGDFRDR
jgi:CRP-like cAMP-binding protein